MQAPLPKLDPLRDIEPNATILIIGGMSSGKTTLARHLLQTWGRGTPFHHRIMFSPSEKIVPQYRNDSGPPEKSVMARNHVWTSLRKHHPKLRTFFDRQEERHVYDSTERAVAVIDENANDSGLLYKHKTDFKIALNHYITRGPKVNMGLIMTAMNPTNIPPELRPQIRWIFVLKRAPDNRIRESWTPCLSAPSFEALLEEARKINYGWGCLVIHNNPMASTKLYNYHFNPD